LRYSTVWNAVYTAMRDRAYEIAQRWAAERKEQMIPAAFDLLERMLPTEIIQLPVVADAEQVCGVPIGAHS
jgi:hypothetical protein